VIGGIPDSWDQSIDVLMGDSSMESSKYFTAWSPCGQFIAAQTKKTVEIRDSLTFELLSTLQPANTTSQLLGMLAYSPDGHSLASPSDSAIVVWDIQTGGVAKEFQHEMTTSISLAWSLNGGTICTMVPGQGKHYIYIHDTDLGSTWSPGWFFERDTQHLCTHNETFRILTSPVAGGTIHIFEVGPTLTTAESFPFPQKYSVRSFSPTTYRISALTDGDYPRLVILDIQDLRDLLDEAGEFESHHFSSNGGLFAASIQSWVHIWKFEDGCYTSWRKLLTGFYASSNPHLLFSPTLLSIMARFGDTLRLWHLDSPPVAPTAHHKQLTIISHSGTYIATSHYQKSTITITNLLSQTPSQLIDTNIEIAKLELTNNILLVVGSGVIVAWLLTDEGLVNNILANGRADCSNSIWTVDISGPHSQQLVFSVEGGIGVIKSNQTILHSYNTRTGESPRPTRVSQCLNGPWYSLEDALQAQNRLIDNSMGGIPPKDKWIPSTREGWVKDSEGKCLLWLPTEWRLADQGKVEWIPKATTMHLISPQLESVFIKLF
jgi:hypothetical protein